MWFRTCLILALVGLFLHQTYQAVERLLAKETVTKIDSAEVEKLVQMPAITFCNYDVKGYSYARPLLPTMREEEEKLKELNRQLIVSVNFVRHYLLSPEDGEIDYTNEQHLADLNLSWNDVWQAHHSLSYTLSGHSRCETFNLPVKFKPSKYVQLSFKLNLSSSDDLAIKVHEPNQIISMVNENLGSTTISFSLQKDFYSINQKAIRHKLTPRRNCDETNKFNFKECLEDFIDKKMPCSLPWRNNSKGLRECNSQGDMNFYRNLTLHIEESTISELQDLTGCLEHCHYRKYSIKFIASLSNVENDYMTFHFMMPERVIPVEEDVIAYDFLSFVGNVGGFLGLLLGLSCLQIYDIAAQTIQSLKGRMELCKLSQR